jgi:hypothetical protein
MRMRISRVSRMAAWISWSDIPTLTEPQWSSDPAKKTGISISMTGRLRAP